MHIGVFDSGKGGEFVAAKLRLLLPENQYTVINDRNHAPYGERPYQEIRSLTETAIQPLLPICDMIVLACNTASAAAIDHLRTTYPDMVFVGFEPMIKPAMLHSTNAHITLLATAATASAPRTQQLVERYATDATIDKPTTFGWASAIDDGRADAIDLSEVAKSVAAGSDAILISCTHYMELQSRLEQLGVTVLEPTEPVARRIQTLMQASR